MQQLYSANRNIFDGNNGQSIVPWGSVTCLALSPLDTLSRDIGTFYFATVSEGHPLYPQGHPLPDGRRLIIWAD